MVEIRKVEFHIFSIEDSAVTLETIIMENILLQKKTSHKNVTK